jgi:uncharacterized protein (TIGR00251 family)
LSNHSYYSFDKSGAIRITVKVEPRSSRPGVTGLHGNALKVRLSSPPVEGRANEELVEILAEALGVRRAQVGIVGGQASKNKSVRVEGADEAAVRGLGAGSEPQRK